MIPAIKELSLVGETMKTTMATQPQTKHSIAPLYDGTQKTQFSFANWYPLRSIKYRVLESGRQGKR